MWAWIINYQGKQVFPFYILILPMSKFSRIDASLFLCWLSRFSIWHATIQFHISFSTLICWVWLSLMIHITNEAHFACCQRVFEVTSMEMVLCTTVSSFIVMKIWDWPQISSVVPLMSFIFSSSSGLNCRSAFLFSFLFFSLLIKVLFC